MALGYGERIATGTPRSLPSRGRYQKGQGLAYYQTPESSSQSFGAIPRVVVASATLSISRATLQYTCKRFSPRILAATCRFAEPTSENPHHYPIDRLISNFFRIFSGRRGLAVAKSGCSFLGFIADF